MHTVWAQLDGGAKVTAGESVLSVGLDKVDVDVAVPGERHAREH